MNKSMLRSAHISILITASYNTPFAGFSQSYQKHRCTVFEICPLFGQVLLTQQTNFTTQVYAIVLLSAFELKSLI